MAEKRQIAISKIAIFIISIFIWIALSFALVFYGKYTDGIEFNASIDSLFNGNRVISSTIADRVDGNLNPIKVEPVGLRELMGPSHQNDEIIIAGKEPLMYMPEAPTEDAGAEAMERYQEQLTEWNKTKGLSDYFKRENGGFKVVEITKQPTGYNVVVYISKDMAFKIPERKWIPETDNGYGFVIPGRSISTGRATVQQAYLGASEYLAEKNGATYRSSNVQAVTTFPLLRSKYHMLTNMAPTDVIHSDVPFGKWDNKGNPYVENDQWMVWYGFEGRHYEITEDQNTFYKAWVIYSSIGALALLIAGAIYAFRAKFNVKIK